MSRLAIDRTGWRFGRWTVLRRAERKDAGRHIFYECRCECGNVRVVHSFSLTSGQSSQCDACRQAAIEFAPGELVGGGVLQLLWAINTDRGVVQCTRCLHVHEVRRSSLAHVSCRSCGRVA